MEQAVSCRNDYQGPAESEGMRALRAQVAAIERGAAVGDGSGLAEQAILPLGLAEIDQTLPAGGLACGAVHEASGSAVGGFAAWLAGRLVRQRGGAVLWCVKPGGTGQLYGPGLAAFGLDVRGLIIVRSRRRADMLWVMEESLRCPAFAAVIGECDEEINLAASRRLQLAAESGGTTGLILRRGGVAAAADRTKPKLIPNACASRWQVDASASNAHWNPRGEIDSELGRELESGTSGLEMTGMGTPGMAPSDMGPSGMGPSGMGTRWQMSLKRCRGGFGSGTWLVEHDEATGDFALVATLGDRPAETGKERRLAG